ncbi:MAG: DUF2934 domain-containing protein [Phycisphaerae bacterium]
MTRKKSGETITKKPARPRKTTPTRRRTMRTGTSTAAKSAPSASVLPNTEAQIRERAYFIYLERGRAPGNALADWLRAERELNGATDAIRA